MKKILVSALAAMSLVACVQDELVTAPQEAAISFQGAYVQNATRAAVDPSTTTASIDGFDVWAFMNEWDGKVLADEDVKKAGNGWTYANTQYWTPLNKYYFAALAPMNSANVTETLATSNEAAKLGLGTIAFTNVDGSEDLLYAATMVETPRYEDLKLNNMPPVKFTFSHLLSKVKFTFTNGFATDNAYVVVRDIQMVAPKTGTIDLAVENWWDNDDWQLGTEEVTLAFGDVEKLAMGAKAECATERLTIPTEAEQVYDITFKVDLYMGEQLAYTFDKTSTVTGVAFEMGKAYNLKAVINSDNLDLPKVEFAVEVKEWDLPYVDVEHPQSAFKEGSTYYVAAADGLAQVAEEINAGTFTGNVELVGDIDLSAVMTRSAVTSNWTPLGNEDVVFTGVFDGKGYTIKNLNLVYTDPAYFVGFFGCVENATIKNVTFENVYVNVASNDSNEGGHIAAVAGYAKNTTFENITVKGNVVVESNLDKNASSRVAVIAGGNYDGTVVMKDVHIEANEGSYVKANNCVGGLAGQLQGTATFEDCTSNIDVTGYKFFAGGIIGLSAQNSTFTNCHTTGDVAILAGRAGNANDLYRVGGIAGGWGDNLSATLVVDGCSYEGTVSGQDAAGKVAQTLDCAGYVGRGYAANVGATVSVNGTTYVYQGNGVYYAVGTIVEVGGAKAVIYSVTDEGVKAVSVEELNLNGKNLSSATAWAEGLGEGYHLATMEELDEIWTVRKALNVALAADNAENALFCETDYIQGTTYAVYLSSTLAEGNDPQGNAYFANRVHLKYFNATGYWDYPYSTMTTINKSAPLKSNYFARAVVEL